MATAKKTTAPDSEVYKTLAAGVIVRPPSDGPGTTTDGTPLPAGTILDPDACDPEDLQRLVDAGLVTRLSLSGTAKLPVKAAARKDPKVTPVLPTGRTQYLATVQLVVKTRTSRAYVHAGQPLPADTDPADVQRLVALGMVRTRENPYEQQG